MGLRLSQELGYYGNEIITEMRGHHRNEVIMEMELSWEWSHHRNEGVYNRNGTMVEKRLSWEWGYHRNRAIMGMGLPFDNTQLSSLDHISYAGRDSTNT